MKINQNQFSYCQGVLKRKTLWDLKKEIPFKLFITHKIENKKRIKDLEKTIFNFFFLLNVFSVVIVVVAPDDGKWMEQKIKNKKKGKFLLRAVKKYKNHWGRILIRIKFIEKKICGKKKKIGKWKNRVKLRGGKYVSRRLKVKIFLKF